MFTLCIVTLVVSVAGFFLSAAAMIGVTKLEDWKHLFELKLSNIESDIKRKRS